MTNLARLIHYWEVLLEVQGYQMTPTAAVEVELTIKFLKELKELKGE